MSKHSMRLEVNAVITKIRQLTCLAVLLSLCFISRQAEGLDLSRVGLQPAASFPNPVQLPRRSCPNASDYVANQPSLHSQVDPVGLIPAAFANNSDCAALGADSPCAEHFVYTPNPAAPWRQPLLVFLPGTNMEPVLHSLVLQTAAYSGYRTIGLSYDNTVNPIVCAAAACGDNCRGEFLTEVLLGFDASVHIDVGAEDSVITRLYRLLEHLDATDPAGGWSSYYVPTAGLPFPRHIVWSNIIVSGFSKGANVAAYISRFVQVHGLVVLDGAKDSCDDNGTLIEAEWLSNTAATDASAGRPKYGVAHAAGLLDPLIAWEVLGISSTISSIDGFGGFDVIDRIPPPRASETNQATATGDPICSTHMSMARDECLPTDLSGAQEALSPEESRLFNPYLMRFCHACDLATCP